MFVSNSQAFKWLNGGCLYAIRDGPLIVVKLECLDLVLMQQLSSGKDHTIAAFCFLFFCSSTSVGNS